MTAPDWWIKSGYAAQAAQELVWFVVIVFVVIGIVLWRDCRSETKEKKDD